MTPSPPPPQGASSHAAPGNERFDPWLVPIIAHRVNLELSVDEAAERLSDLLAKHGTPTSDERPFRGEVTHEGFALQVRIPTSGMSAGIVPLERTLIVVSGALEPRDVGCHMVLSLRQPLPAFVLLIVIWAGFIYTVAAGASPFLLFTPLSGHAILILFFRFTAYQRVISPMRKALGAKLA